MTRLLSPAAACAAAALSVLPASAVLAQPARLPSAQQPNESVAGAFIAAAQAQDRKAALQLLDQSVSIQFPEESAGQGHGEGQPFVIGYLDGLFYGQRAVSLDGPAAPQDGAVRFLAHDARSNARYDIDVEVKDQRVVRVTVKLEGAQAPGQSVAVLDSL